MIGRAWFRALLGATLAATLAFLVLPVVAIFTHTAPGQLISRLGDPTATEALRLSLETSTIGSINGECDSCAHPADSHTQRAVGILSRSLSLDLIH